MCVRTHRLCNEMHFSLKKNALKPITHECRPCYGWELKKRISRSATHYDYSSATQWPESGTTSTSRFVASCDRLTTVFSPSKYCAPIANTRIVNLPCSTTARQLSSPSW